MGCPARHAACRLGALLLAVGALIPDVAVANGARIQSETNCALGITPAIAGQLQACLGSGETRDGCKLDDLQTLKWQMRVLWRKGNQVLGPIVIEPRGCSRDPLAVGTDYAIRRGSEDRDVARSCPDAYGLLREAVERDQLDPPVPVAPDRPGGPVTESSVKVGLSVFAAAFALFVVFTLRPLLRGRMQVDAPWVMLLFGGFGLALVARLLVQPDLANWYTEVLRQGEPLRPARFGPGPFIFQAALRAVLPWRDTTLSGANEVLGALSIPIFLAVLRECEVDLRTALYVAVLFALAPFHVRASASPSEHILSSTMTLLLLFSWLRAFRTGDMLATALSLLLLPAIVLTRADAWMQLSAVPFWAVLAARHQASGEAPRGHRQAWVLGGAYGVTWLATGFIAYYLVVLPSRHPGPELAAVLYALRSFLRQFWDAGFTDPYWLSPAAVVLAVPGLVWMLLRRTGLLLAVLLTLLAILVPLGRNLQFDGLLGVRYLLVAIPVFLVVPAFGLTAFVTLLLDAWPGRIVGRSGGATGAPGRAARAGIDLAAVLVLVAATVVPALPAYGYRYTFQDEYRFLRAQLGKLPHGCEVYQLPIRTEGLEVDLDCCLDVPRSPLPIVFPQLRFRVLEDPNEPAPADPAVSCRVYYETAACSLQQTAEVVSRRPMSYEIFRRRCAAVRATGLMPITRVEVSAQASHDLFGGVAPRVGLFHWKP
jgi:hypothetical protein